MVDDTGKTPNRPRGHLPFNEEDLALAMGGEHDSYEEREVGACAVSYVKIFFTLVFAAPVAAFLAMAAMDIYPAVTEIVGIRAPEPLVIKAVEPVKSESASGEKLGKLIQSVEKSNKALVNAVNKQAAAVLKLANKKPGVIKVEAPNIKLEAPKNSKTQAVASPQIVVVKVPSQERFNLSYEKEKILKLSGVDLDDPVTDSNPFAKVKSRDALKEIVRSLDAIIAASRYHDEVGDFLKGNALKAKRFAAESLAKTK